MPTLHIACLCAAWCRTCEAYGATLRAVADEFQGRGLAQLPRWIDIEDDADLVGDLDVETFPTLVIWDDGGTRFAGPITPQPETLRRLLENLVGADGGAVAATDPEIAALVARLRAL